MTSDWYLGQLQRSATLTQAQTSALAEVNSQLAAATKATGSARSIGLTAIEERNFARNTNPDAVAEFDDLIREEMKAGADRRTAMVRVCRRHPEIHASMLNAANERDPDALNAISRRFR